jgi:hypothetical protein
MDNSQQQALTLAHLKVEDLIDTWHESDTENNLVDFLGWSELEYKLYVEKNQLPERELEQFLLA